MRVVTVLSRPAGSARGHASDNIDFPRFTIDPAYTTTREVRFARAGLPAGEKLDEEKDDNKTSDEVGSGAHPPGALAR